MKTQVSILTTFYSKLSWGQIPKAQKRHSSLHGLFVLLESALVKAARKKLVKLTTGLHEEVIHQINYEYPQGVNFINILRTNFSYECHFL